MMAQTVVLLRTFMPYLVLKTQQFQLQKDEFTTKSNLLRMFVFFSFCLKFVCCSKLFSSHKYNGTRLLLSNGAQGSRKEDNSQKWCVYNQEKLLRSSYVQVILILG